MKNLFLLQTDKPSRLVLNSINNNLFLTTTKSFPTDIMKFQNIYITSDEEIKDVRPHKGKWQLEEGEILNKFPNYLTDLSECKLVIMTTDQDLIKDGVQAIDDEFLEWFIKNPNCEEVDVEQVSIMEKRFVLNYKIIIPKEENYERINQPISLSEVDKEEPKQETLEEAAERAVNSCFKEQTLFRLGAKWQQEQDKKLYSDLVDLLERLRPIYKEDSVSHFKCEKQRINIIEQFKNK